MADMYGAVRSNDFTVKDVEKFKAWFKTYHFGSEIELFISDEGRCVSFGGYEQYPSAYPRRFDADGFPTDADLQPFAEELCDHLEPGEVFSVTAGGYEKLRYVSFDQLIIAQEHPNEPLYEHYSSDDGNDVLLNRLHGEESPTIDFHPDRQRRTASALLAACRMVVERWERGDLAEAARACAAAIAEAEAADIDQQPGDPAAILRKIREAAEEYDEMGRDFPLHHLLDIFSLAKAKMPTGSEAPTIRIEVRGGVVQHVSNVPPGWLYEIIDHDNAN